jgi:hypothetical protein
MEMKFQIVVALMKDLHVSFDVEMKLQSIIDLTKVSHALLSTSVKNEEERALCPSRRGSQLALGPARSRSSAHHEEPIEAVTLPYVWCLVQGRRIPV